MSQAIGILELTSIAKGMEAGDAMLKKRECEFTGQQDHLPGQISAYARW